MKALSIHPEYAMQIFLGEKTVEWRSWKTDYRGDLLICSTAKRFPGTISGHAICVARLTDIVPWNGKYREAAKIDFTPSPRGYAWMLDDLRIIKPFPVRGQLGLFNVDHPIEYYEDNGNDEEAVAFAEKYITPLIYIPAQQ